MLPVYYISHGGGPWPWMDGMIDGPYAALAASLAAIPAALPEKPRAILMVSAHWEESSFTVQANPKPGMVYDYYGFPEHTYSIEYAASGDPGLAQQVHGLIQEAGLSAAMDTERGYDHGLYAPMAVAYPNADMPIIQLSLQKGLNPAEHIKLGQALAILRQQGILLIGSGLSYHNLRLFGPAAIEVSKPFDNWLQQIIKLPQEDRVQQLLDWELAPNARLCHPREEHLLPLMFSVGAAMDDMGKCIYQEDDFMGGVVASSFCFGNI